MPFDPKDWLDLPAELEPEPDETVAEWRDRIAAYNAANPGVLTPVSAAGLIDLEQRVADYADAQVAAQAGAIATLTGRQSVALAVRDILDVGVLNQTRAGRVLLPTDFTDLGLAAPAGLWNLSNVNDSSGNGRTLTNKGAVPFGKGIMGAAAEAAVFAGSTAQALWRADEAALSIRHGSWGCWFRTAKRGTTQSVVTKASSVAGQRSYSLTILPANTLEGAVYSDGTSNFAVVGTADVCDDRWHFAVVTWDGTAVRVYLDGLLETAANYPSPAAPPIFDGTAPFNIGAFGADAGTAAVNPFYGRVDEAFLTNEVLNEEQVRLLMCAKLAHGSPVAPRRVGLMVRRRRRGPLWTQGDFTALGLAAPLRLYNLDDLSDDGTAGTGLTASGGVAAGSAAGPAGKAGLAMNLDGTDDYASATDAGLPTGTATRTLLAWFKTSETGNREIMSYGAAVNGQFIRLEISNTTAGALGVSDGNTFIVGPWVADGQWHFVALVMDNSAADGVKRKLYLDGRLVGGDTTFSTTVLGGVGQFVVGADQGHIRFWKGQLARVAVGAFAMTPDQIEALHAKGTQDLGLSPYAEGEYVERVTATDLYVLAERGTLEDQEQVELEVAA